MSDEDRKNLDDHPCPECDKAYPHPLLKEKHLVEAHPEKFNRNGVQG